MAQAPTLRERALRLLAQREHSRAELARKLSAHLSPEDDLDRLLDELTSRNLLSEARYAESRVRRLGEKFGTARIEHELRAKGLSREAAAAAATSARASELDRARVVWRRKFGSSPKTRDERARQIRFMQARGFSFDVIRSLLGKTEDD